MDKRYLGAVMIAPLLIFLFLGGIALKLVIMILSLVGLYEFYKVVGEKRINPISILGYGLTLLYYLLINKNFNFEIITLLLIITFLFCLCVPVLNLKFNFIDVAITIFGFLYVTVFFSFIVLVEQKQYGNFLVWVIFISSWGCDTAAYYAGRMFGKRKISPKVSPKKTVEGSIGGLLGSIIGCTIYGMFVITKGVDVPLWHFAIIGVICGVLGQFGDLVASSIKRYIGVKDYSNLIPGHGGILDRFDSIIFSAVAIYYYISFIIKL